MIYEDYANYIRSIAPSGQSVWSRISSILDGNREYNIDEINYLLYYMDEIQQDSNVSSRELGKIARFTPELLKLLPSNSPTSPLSPALPPSTTPYTSVMNGQGEGSNAVSVTMLALILGGLWLLRRRR